MEQSATHPAALSALRDWFCNIALPLWAAHGYDGVGGGFYEALKPDATPSTGRERRVRTQARQIHTFSQAGLRGWHDSAEALAAEGFDYFLSRACPGDGARGCVHRLDDGGAVIDDRRDLYDQAFVLLACASRWEAARDARAVSLAERTVSFLDRELLSSHGGWFESDRKELPRRQNPHMHLFEAFLALHRATGRDDFLGRANDLRELFERVFFDGKEDVVREFFDAEWRIDESDNQPVEPGHMLEWSWLLGAHDAVSGENSIDIRHRLYARARLIGVDPGFYGFYDNEACLTGGAHGAKRLWPQTEGLRAALALGRTDDAELIAENLLKTYLATEVPGLWVDEFGADGRPVAKDTPASILYHLYEAVAEVDAHLDS